MGNYWKKRFFQERHKAHRRKRQMKIVLGITIALALVFGTLFMIGYTGKQAQKAANETANSAYTQLVNWVNTVQDNIGTIFIAIIIILIILFWIWLMIPKTETTYYSGGY